MAEILGVGLTHSPSLIKPDEEMDFSITRSLRNPNLPAGTEDSHQLARADAYRVWRGRRIVLG